MSKEIKWWYNFRYKGWCFNFRENIDSLNVEPGNINQYEHGYDLGISGEKIPYGITTENCRNIVIILFWQRSNMNLGKDKLSISYRVGEYLLMALKIGKYS